MKELKTKRLIIRRFQESDWEDLYEYLADEEVVYYEPYEVFSREKCQEEARIRSVSKAFWAVCLQENGKMIGNLYFERGKYDTWEIGYVFNLQYQGQGYAAEAAKALLDEGFQNWGVRRVVAMCNPGNQQSWKLMERLGMRREGLLVKNIFFKSDEHGKPIWQDTYEYGILKEEWDSNQRV